MQLPTPEIAFSAASKSANMARMAATVMGGRVSDADNRSVGLSLAYANAGRFEDAYKAIDEVSNSAKAWVPTMLLLRAAQATYGNASGKQGTIEPCSVCSTPKPPVFSGDRLCLTCLQTPPSTLETVSQG